MTHQTQQFSGFKGSARLKMTMLGLLYTFIVCYLGYLLIEVYFRGQPLIPSTTTIIRITIIFSIVSFCFLKIANLFRYVINDFELSYHAGKTPKYIKWENVSRLEYRKASLLTGFFNELTVHSKFGVKIHVHDGYRDFDELVKIICEKTGLEPEVKSWWRRKHRL